MGVHDMAESQQYGRKVGGMIGRGALNVVTCFVDVIVNVVKETKAGPPLVGTFTGLGRGTGCGVLRLGSGAVDLVTFWVPGFNGFPVSDSYEHCLAVSASPPSVSEEERRLPDKRRATSLWEVPTTEPGAAQAPSAKPGMPAKKTWKK
jgi:putative exosortase-associated protein (TIGR04073 family)